MHKAQGPRTKPGQGPREKLRNDYPQPHEFRMMGLRIAAATSPSVQFQDYFRNRKKVETQFREAVQARWDVETLRRWDVSPSSVSTRDAGSVPYWEDTVRIPEVKVVAEKEQLSAKIQDTGGAE